MYMQHLLRKVVPSHQNLVVFLRHFARPDLAEERLTGGMRDECLVVGLDRQRDDGRRAEQRQFSHQQLVRVRLVRRVAFAQHTDRQPLKMPAYDVNTVYDCCCCCLNDRATQCAMIKIMSVQAHKKVIHLKLIALHAHECTHV